MNTPSTPPPTWTDGFAVGPSNHRVTIYFVTGQPDLSQEGPEKTTVPTIHSSVTMSFDTARKLCESLDDAIGKEANKEVP